MSDSTKQQNRALCEASQGVWIRETLLASEIKLLAKEANGVTSYRAKVSHAGKKNGNDRIYPEAEWGANIERCKKEKIPQGMLIGAVDHDSWDSGGNLKDSPIMWRSLEMDAMGAVFGEFTIITGHSRGKDLQAQIDAGMCVGFSTVGRGRGMEPTPDERKKYGLGEDEYAVIIKEYELVRIDAVSDPSCEDARLQPESKSEKTMNTLVELKEKFPGVFALHEQAIAEVQGKLDEQIKSAGEQSKKIADLDAKVLELTNSATAIKTFLADTMSKLGKEHNVDVPFREVAEKEAAEKIDALTKQLSEKETALKTADGLKVKAEKELADRDAALANEKRQNDLKAKLPELLKDNKFAEAIKKIAEGKIAEAAFDVKALEQLITDKTAEYEAALVAKQPEGDKVLGTPSQQLGDKPAGDDEAVLPWAKEMAGK